MSLSSSMQWMLFLIFLALRWTINQSESCKTISNTSGTCRLERECSFYMNIAKKNASIARMMSEKRCGFSGNSLIVCCPMESDTRMDFVESGKSLGFARVGEECPLYGNFTGVCRLDADCPLVKSQTNTRAKNNLAFYNQRCGFQDANVIVCCPTDNDSLRVVMGFYTKRKSEQACDRFGPQTIVVSSRILGGISADKNEIPQFASLGYQDLLSNKFSFHCGGALISEKFVLTAAHCFSKSMVLKRHIVRLGKNSINGTEDLQSDYRIKTIISHPDYKINMSKYNDIALLELSRTVRFKTNVWPACLTQQEAALNSPLTIAGFGRTSAINALQRAEKLLKATVYEVSLDECRKNYSEILSGNNKQIYGMPSGIPDTFLCAKSQGKHADTCQGDSGSGLFMLVDRTYYVLGITSFGLSCNSPLPAFYTRVHKYLTWIEDIVWPE